MIVSIPSLCRQTRHTLRWYLPRGCLEVSATISFILEVTHLNTISLAEGALIMLKIALNCVSPMGKSEESAFDGDVGEGPSKLHI